MYAEFTEYLTKLEASRYTIKGYLTDLRTAVKNDIISLNFQTLNLQKLLELNHKAATKHRIRSAIRKYARFLVKQKIIENVPSEIDALDLPKIANLLPKVTRSEQTKKLLTKEHNNETKLIILLLATTGCRISSIPDIRMENINGAEITFTKAKNNKPYVSIITSEMLECIKRFTNKTSGFLFTKSNGKPYTPDGIRMKLKRALGKDYVIPHSYRYGIASDLFENGVDILAIKEFLNHSSMATTQKYIQVTKSFMKKEIEGKHPFLKPSD